MREGARTRKIEIPSVPTAGLSTGLTYTLALRAVMALQLVGGRGNVTAEKPIQLRDLPPLLSFFTGAGFLDLGVMQVGFPIIWSLEKEERFADAHDHGMQ